MKLRYVLVLVFVGIVLNAVVFLFVNRMQMQEMYQTAKSIKTTLDAKLSNAVNSVEYLHLVAKKQLEQRNKLELYYTPLIQKSSDGKYFALDKKICNNTPSDKGVNLLGSALVLNEKDTLHEMEAALQLCDYMKLIYNEHKNFAWIYYFSKKNFTVLYPFISAKDFQYNINLREMPFFQYATPKNNPKRKLFFTPLYKDAIGKGLMLTIGKPLYDGREFLGTINLDVTLNHVDTLLSNLDNLHYKSVLYNEEHEVLGSSKLITDFERTKIYKIDDYLSKELLGARNTFTNIKYLDGKYVYMKTIKNTPIHFVYFIDAYTIWFKSFVLILPLFVSLLLIALLLLLYRRVKYHSLVLKEQSIRDYMTGAYNRRYFFDVAEKIFLKSKRKDASVAIVMTDIDDFKHVNDTYGHSAGDKAIIQMKEIFEKNLRESDLYARFGGEEFCIILDDISKKDVEKLMEKIRKEFEVNVIVAGYHRFSYTVSFGIAYGMLDSLENMISLADKALYKSKEKGKNIVTTYETYS
ncbi:sensor domain-containing diguanylate cyclase [Sulfurimonas sp.]|uniref:sensor domain-containing diguanylate cyclase n=1 Tax=Sulfurimonas sp. TaxID=2022749 RepID=UPI0026152422|nr:sensor domain-containing diguanylate cyclase [Sulfurimonas sp.]